jgi:lipopolysaccharide transport system ATP-binding protein
MSDVIVHARNLRKVYRLYARPRDRLLDMLGLLGDKPGRVHDHVAINDIDLDIRRGERVAVIGRNGAGKSTLLKLITQVINPTSGVLEVSGRSHALLQIGTGFHPDFTGRQNAYAFLGTYGIVGRQADALVEEIIDFAEIDTYIDQPVKSYSTGMGARLMFAASTALRPEILIIDEVLSVGDAYFSHKSFERIRTMTEAEGTTLILVSHDIGRAMSVCDRFIWIDDGTIRMDADPKSVANRYALSVREQEEQRLRLRRTAGKAPPGAARNAAGGQPIFAQLRRRGGMPAERDLAIASITIARAGTELAHLDTADPTRCRNAELLAAPDESNWSEVRDVEGRTGRCFTRHGSIFHRAAFLLHPPPGTPPLAPEEALTATVTLFDGQTGAYLVEIYPDPKNKACFRGPLELTGSDEWRSIDVETAWTTEAEPIEGRVRFGTQLFSIEEVQTFDETGEPTQIFRVGGRLEVRLRYRINDPGFRSRPVIQVNFQRDGLRLGRMVLKHHLFDAAQSRQGELRAAFDPLRMGPGTYLVNVAVMSEGGYDADAAPIYFTANPMLLDHHTRGYEIKIEPTHDRLVDDLAFMHDATWIVDGQVRESSPLPLDAICDGERSTDDV